MNVPFKYSLTIQSSFFKRYLHGWKIKDLASILKLFTILFIGLIFRIGLTLFYFFSGMKKLTRIELFYFIYDLLSLHVCYFDLYSCVFVFEKSGIVTVSSDLMLTSASTDLIEIF